MIKFEEHDGKLFRMLEKPVPLTDDAELPVLVRMIQDDTMLGKANKRSCHPDTLARKIICSSSNLTDDGLFMNGNYTYRYEIIGTLVEEGSKEWALYRLGTGNIVIGVYLGDDVIVTPESKGWHEVIRVDLYGKRRGMPITDSDFLFHAEKDGWQLYEPKPESQYKVGDWVKYDIDTYLQVTEASGSERTWCKTLSGITVYPYTSCLSKIDPSEVIVKIGCLSGTIAKSSDPNYFLMLHSRPITNCNYSMIRFSAIDTQTRETVEGLLKATLRAEARVTKRTRLHAQKEES